MAGKHAKLSPSGASGWMRCSQWESTGGSSEFSREGTAAHDLASRVLEDPKKMCYDYIGSDIVVEGQTFSVDSEMADYVQEYVDIVRTLGGELFVEQSLSIERFTGEGDAKGTSDAIVVNGTELFCVDLKFGKGVKVDAVDNEQLLMYALGAYDMVSLVHRIEKITLIISQPRIYHVSEWTITPADLITFKNRVEVASRIAGTGDPTPGDKQCRWCSKKARCPDLAAFVENSAMIDFDDLTVTPPIPLDNSDLADKMLAIPLIETWCKSIRDTVESELISGRSVPGYKIVKGRQGNRQWKDKAEVENCMKGFGLSDDAMYKKSVISPPDAEKLLAKTQPERWQAIKDFITRSDGQPTVAPTSDKRAPLSLEECVKDFDDVSES